MESEERSWLDRAQRGDKAALEALLGSTRAPVLSLLRSILGNVPDAEDACQEALMVASTNLSSLREGQRFLPWVIGIALHKARDIQRRDARERTHLSQLPPPSLRLAPDDRDERMLAVMNVLRSLPEEQRIAVNLKYHSGLRYAEIAELMAVPLSTVRGLLARATATLRQSLRDSSASI